jgi:hypothetical protein
MIMVMEFIKKISKQLGLVLSLLGGLLILGELPHHERNVLSHQERIAQLGTKLPAYEVKTFLRHIESRLPYYREEFQQAEQKTGIPWTLLAAMAYQESKWNHKAVSPTGVRGIMMLTRSTASDLGITNRLDPSKSIAGGGNASGSNNNGNLGVCIECEGRKEERPGIHCKKNPPNFTLAPNTPLFMPTTRQTPPIDHYLYNPSFGANFFFSSSHSQK